MITVDGVSARRSRERLNRVSLSWGPGIHSIIGAPGDGGALLLAVVAGEARRRSGRVAILDSAPTGTATRKQMAYVAAKVNLPSALRVDEALAVAAAIRGEPVQDAAERLSVLGIEALGACLIRSLSQEAARTVALAEAVTSRVSVILIDEPLVGIDARAAGRLGEALRVKARDGCTVVFSTGSSRDAGELAEDHVFLRGGVVAGKAASLEALYRLGANGARLRVVTKDVADARALVAMLARGGQVDGVEQRGAALRVRGADATGLARAVGHAAIEAEIDVVELRFEPPTADRPSDAAVAVAGAAQ